MSKLLAASAAIAALVIALPAQAQDGRTTRIEPRPFYGATVTIEEGVRVFRPLPPTKHVIINPDGETPLNLGFHETRVYQKSSNFNYHQHEHNGGNGSGRGSFFPNVGRIGVGN
ncbi:MAG: hypothetical protein KJ622_01655 [Alphaproteobacteria bacterium]|nr:hypothetical protein [Alphaproteobacteria bacterium]